MFVKFLVPIVYSFISSLILTAKEKSKNESVKELLTNLNIVLEGYSVAIGSGGKNKILQSVEAYFIERPGLHLRIWDSLGRVLLSLHPDKKEAIDFLGKAIIVEKKPFSKAESPKWFKDKIK